MPVTAVAEASAGASGERCWSEVTGGSSGPRGAASLCPRPAVKWNLERCLWLYCPQVRLSESANESVNSLIFFTNGLFLRLLKLELISVTCQEES